MCAEMRLWIYSSVLLNRCLLALLRVVRTVVEAAGITPNAKQTLFGVTDLVTPLGLYPHAVLRERDIVQIEARVSAATLTSIIDA